MSKSGSKKKNQKAKAQSQPDSRLATAQPPTVDEMLQAAFDIIAETLVMQRVAANRQYAASAPPVAPPIDEPPEDDDESQDLEPALQAVKEG